MSATKIDWCNETWNIVAGCTPVSEGCEHCWAARLVSGRLSRLPAYKGLARDGRWTGEVRTFARRLNEPCHWKRPRHVFVAPLGDLFASESNLDYIYGSLVGEALCVMANSPHHRFYLLTKRPRNMVFALGLWLHTNIWAGATVENQARADERLPELLKCAPHPLYVSCEPLLGPLDLRPWIDKLAWTIVGGESGPDARPMEIEWVEDIAAQCREARVPLFVKQDSGPRPGTQGRLPGNLWAFKEIPEARA